MTLPMSAQVCLSDCLTKMSAKADALRKAIDTGTLPDVDMHPSFRTLMQHKAFLADWLVNYVGHHCRHCLFLGSALQEQAPAY